MIELINWILEEGRDSDDLGAIFTGVIERLVARGIPLCRANVSMPTIDPTAAVVSFRWSRDEGLTSASLTPEEAFGAQFRRSPIRYVMERNSSGERWKLEDPEVAQQFVLFEELRALGITEYALRFVPFSKRRTALQGAVLSIATDRPGGFTDAEFETFDRLLPAVSVVAYRIELSRVAVETLGRISVRRPERTCCRAGSGAATAKSFRRRCCSPICAGSPLSPTALRAMTSSSGSTSISNASATPLRSVAAKC